MPRMLLSVYMIAFLSLLNVCTSMCISVSIVGLIPLLILLAAFYRNQAPLVMEHLRSPECECHWPRVWPQTILCGRRAHYPPAEFVKLSVQSTRTLSDVRNKTGGHSPTPQAHGIDSTLLTGKMISTERPWSWPGLFIASDTEGFRWSTDIIVNTQTSSAGRPMRSPQNVLRTELVNGKRWMKENGTHIKTFDGNWDVEPSFGCLFLLAYQCSSSLSVRSLSSTG